MAFKSAVLPAILAHCVWSWSLKPYNPKPNTAGVVQTKEARFTIFTDSMIRLEYELTLCL